MKQGLMKSIRKRLRNLKDYGITPRGRSTRSQRPHTKDASRKLESVLNRFYEGHQTQNLTGYLDMRDPESI